MFNTQTRRIVAGVLVALLSGAGKAAMAEDVASTLASDARFSDYVSAIKVAGLWHAFERAKGITIFAPTNDAFATLGKDWQEHLLPMTLQDDGDVTLMRAQRETFIEGATIHGTYPEGQFRGKITRVKAASGYYFTVDGTQPGKLVINPRQASTEVTIGAPPPKKERTTTAGSPIVADNGLIYPTDGFANTYDPQP